MAENKHLKAFVLNGSMSLNTLAEITAEAAHRRAAETDRASPIITDH